MCVPSTEIERAAYTVDEYLAAVPISRSTFYARVRDGSLRVVRLGGRTLVPRSEIARLLGEEVNSTRA